MQARPDLEAPSTMALAAMPFPERLATLRRDRHLTQQALADLAGLHVSQIRKYETDVTQPSIEAIKKLAVALSVPSDLLLFDQDERGPDDDLRLHFEALARLDPDERQLIKGLIESVVVTHDVKRSGVPSPVMARSA
jgi:transcriptional regulator with XRE-family HTH domain